MELPSPFRATLVQAALSSIVKRHLLIPACHSYLKAMPLVTEIQEMDSWPLKLAFLIHKYVIMSFGTHIIFTDQKCNV